MSSQQPDKMPRFASEAVSGVGEIEPSEARKDAGWVAERPPYQTENWIDKKTYQWIKWLAEQYFINLGRLQNNLKNSLEFKIPYVLKSNPLVEVGYSGEYCIFADGFIYVATVSGNKILKIDPLSLAVTTILATDLASPHGMAYDGNYIWVVDYTDGTLTKFYPGDGAVIEVIDTTDRAAQGICFDGTYMWTGLGNKVAKTHYLTHTVTEILDASFNGIHDLCFDGTHVWVTNYDGDTVSKINIATNVVDGTVATGADPDRLLFDGSAIWVSCRGDDKIQKIDPINEVVLYTLSLSAGEHPIYFTFDGRYVWCVLEDNGKILRLDSITTNTADVITHVFTAPGSTPTLRGICFDGIFIWANYTGGDNATKMLLIPAI